MVRLRLSSKPMRDVQPQAPDQGQLQEASLPTRVGANVVANTLGFIPGAINYIGRAVSPKHYGTSVMPELPGAPEHLKDIAAPQLGYHRQSLEAKSTPERVGTEILSTLPFAAKSAFELGKAGYTAAQAAKSVAKTYLGGYVGGKATREAASYATDNPTLLALADITGTAAGALLTHAATGGTVKKLKVQEQTKKIAEFDKNKRSMIKDIEQKKVQTQNELRKRTSAIKDEFMHDQKNAIKNAEKSKTERLSALEQAEKQRSGRIKDLEATRKKHYAAAEQIAETITEEAPGVRKALKQVEREVQHGVEQASRNRILDVLGQAEALVAGERGALSLSQAKNLKQNLISQSYDRTIPPVVKRSYDKIRKSLDEFIAQAGEKHPKHAEHFKPAEQATVELKELQRNNTDFIKEQLSERKAIEKEYLSEVKNAKKDFGTKIRDAIKENNAEGNSIVKALEAEHKAAQKMSYNDIVKQAKQDALLEQLKAGQEKTNQAISDTTAALITKYALGGGPALAVKAGVPGIRALTNRWKEASRILESHPDLRKDFNDLVKTETIAATPLFQAKLLKFDEKVRRYSQKKEKTSKFRMRY